MRSMAFRRIQWLFPVALALHNGEEAIYMPAWASAHRGQLPLHPRTGAILAGLLLLTLLALAVTILSAQKGKQSTWAYLLFGYTATMLINVVVPHIPATLFFGEYTPGVVTAALINLPVMTILLCKAVSDRWVSGTKAIRYALLVPLAIGSSVFALLALI